MTEDEAQDWTRARFGAEATERLAAFLAMVVEENGRQNLIAPSTIGTIWDRHAVDSLQLVALADGAGDRWLDIGTGGGFPGLAVAAVRPYAMILVEPRRKRAEFLAACVDRLGLGDRVTVETAKVENVQATVDIISARAVSSVGNLLRGAAHCATQDTRWLLPRGRLDEGERAVLQQTWRMMFHVEHSVTNPESAIVVLDGVSAR